MTNEEAIMIIRAIPSKIWNQLDEVEEQAIRNLIVRLENKWIPVSKQYPEYDKTVLTIKNNFYDVETLMKGFDGEEDYWEDNYGFYHDFDSVDAWMPIPEPYKGE